MSCTIAVGNWLTPVPAQIPACALTHGAPASDDDEGQLARLRVLKPIAVTRELRLRVGSESVSFTAWLAVPSGRFRRPWGFPDDTND